MQRNWNRTAGLLVLALGTCWSLAGAGCYSLRFADDIATDAARELADILIDALVIDPVDDAVNEEE